MALPPIVPKGDPLRRAVAWLAEQHEWSAATIEEASRRFDLNEWRSDDAMQAIATAASPITIVAADR